MIPVRKILAGALLAALAGAPVAAQHKLFIPSFADPQQRPAKPDLTHLTAIRFVTEDDYPPFHFALADGQLAGFNIDIARAVCEELQVVCTIQRRQWDLLLPALAERSADAAAASLAMTPQAREQVDFTEPYYATPARFVVRAQSPLADATPETMAAQSVGVVAGSAHEAYLQRYFPAARREAFADAAGARAALKDGRIDAVFGDGVGLAIWLNGADAGACCMFKGGPYTESRYFGEGVGLAVRKGDHALRRALNYALAQMSRKGVYGDIYLKWFPLGFY